jgi:membrane fusion protein (multidrug efflux system)
MLVKLGWVASVLLYAVAVAGAAEAPAVIVSEARLEHFVDRVEALGTLRANESVSITTAVTEIISAVHFEDGERVQGGQVLVELSSAEERAELREAESTVAEARSQYERVQALARQGTEAKSLLDERRRQWETALARRSVVEARLEDFTIRAPFAGVVGLRNISVGALVEPGDMITTLDDDGIMKLEFSVSSVFIPTLRPGLQIDASSSAYGGRRFSGEVRSVDSRVDPVTRSVLVRAVLANSDRALKPGMLMSIVLQKDPRQALVIPEAALIPQGRQQYVLVVDPSNGNRVDRRQIEVGARRPGDAEVLAGLAAGELVITRGSERTQPGEVVEIQAVEVGGDSLETLLGGATPAAGGSQ